MCDAGVWRSLAGNDECAGVVGLGTGGAAVGAAPVGLPRVVTTALECAGAGGAIAPE